MLKINDILTKIDSLEGDISDTDNIVSIEIYSDGSGSIHSHSREYFEFEKLKDLETFVILDNDYLIRNSRKYPL